MKKLSILIISFLLIPNLSLASEVWVNNPKGECTDFSALNKLESSDVIEVSHSKFEVAKSKLLNSPIVEVNSSLVGFYTGVKPEEKGEGKFYLVRALFGNGGTGGFSVFTCGEDLLVSHHSLGNVKNPNETALIIRLVSYPRHVFVKYSSYK